MHRDGRVSHLHDFAVEGAHGERVHREIDILPHLQNADVRLGHIRVDLHLREIIGDLENDRGLQTGRDGLANIDVTRDHDAIDRRRDRAMLKIRFRFVERALFDFHVGFGLMKICHGLIEVRLRGGFSREEILRAFRVYPCQLQRRLCAS